MLKEPEISTATSRKGKEKVNETVKLSVSQVCISQLYTILN